MPADAPTRSQGGGGGGSGGGLTLGPPTNEFTAATKAAAETLRNTYATANATWLASYDDEPTYTITINWPATPTNTVFQARRSSSWADVTGLVRGPKGTAGDDGDQARFEVYAYINTATAPVAAPTGGTFVQTTGTLTVPVGYTAVPSTPASGSKTYRTAAVVNPANDTDTVTLVWSVPAELPAYLAAALAEAAQTAAETARDLAQQYAGQAQDIPAGSPRGVLVATSPTLPTGAVGSNTVIAFGAAELWTLGANAPDGYEAGPTASNERLYLPDIHPAGSNGMFVVIEVGGVEISEVFISQGGIQGATSADRRHILPVSLTADALVRVGFWPRSGATASYIQITGNSDTLSADTVAKVYLAVVRGAGGAGGGGGSEDTDLTIGSRDATTLDVESSTGDDATLPAATILLSGLMAAADKIALNNSGGQHRFGAVDPVATDGNNKDAWVNTADGTLWVKAAGAWTKQYTFPAGGSGPAPTHTGQYLAGKATSTFVATDFTGTAGVEYASGEHTATMPTVTGNVYAGVARLATDPDPTFADVNGTGLNQFADFTQQTGTVTIGGAAHNVWVSDFAVFATGDEVEFR